MFSIITTAPSTIRPKSMAPRLIRLPETPRVEHAGERDEHGERDRRGDDEPAAQIAEQKKQHGDDEERALGEIFGDGLDDFVDQTRSGRKKARC